MSTELRHRTMPAWAIWVGLALFLLLAFAAGFIGNLAQGEDVQARYLSFERPAWAPEADVFGVVWPVLYLLIGVAGWRVWRAAGSVGAAAGALGLWVAQLVLNAVWPGVFFGINEFGAAVGVIVALDLVVIATIVAFWRHDRLAGWLLIPYLVWILYATALNIALLVIN